MTTTGDHTFQPVVYYSLDESRFTLEGSLLGLLDLQDEARVSVRGIPCCPLDLKNKYYQARLHLLDFRRLSVESAAGLLSESYAIILQGSGMRLTTDSLEERLRTLNGEPRILLYSEIDENCTPYATLRDWCIQNGFDMISVESADAKQEIIDSLSAHRWKHMTMASNGNRIRRTSSTTPEASDGTVAASSKLDDELVKKLVDFDQLLSKLSVYRDQPELRGNPDDKNIVEIAEILSNLLTDDGDEFLREEDDDGDGDDLTSAAAATSDANQTAT